MKIFLFCFLLLSMGCASNLKTAPPTTIILVRHAEKQKGQNPSLTVAGQKRAQELISHAMTYKITGIYSTNYKRTMETAKPLADKLKIKINTSIHPTNYQAFVDDIKKNHSGQAVLVVGHSNTVPAFINYLFPKQNLQTIAEKDYSNLFIIEIRDKATHIKKMTY